MAAAEKPEPLYCVCGALVLKARTEGIEAHCRRCDRRWVIPYGEVQDKEHLVQFMRAWRARAKRA